MPAPDIPAPPAAGLAMPDRAIAAAALFSFCTRGEEGVVRAGVVAAWRVSVLSSSVMHSVASALARDADSTMLGAVHGRPADSASSSFWHCVRISISRDWPCATLAAAVEYWPPNAAPCALTAAPLANVSPVFAAAAPAPAPDPPWPPMPPI